MLQELDNIPSYISSVQHLRCCCAARNTVESAGHGPYAACSGRWVEPDEFHCEKYYQEKTERYGQIWRERSIQQSILYALAVALP